MIDFSETWTQSFLGSIDNNKLFFILIWGLLGGLLEAQRGVGFAVEFDVLTFDFIHSYITFPGFSHSRYNKVNYPLVHYVFSDPSERGGAGSSSTENKSYEKVGMLYIK